MTVLRNGDVKQQNRLTRSQMDKIIQSSHTLSEKDDEEKGQVSPLPGSLVNLDIVTWPADEEPQGQVHVTVIQSGQVSSSLPGA